MADILDFPTSATPAEPDPPPECYKAARERILELEHEVLDLQIVVAEQAVALMRARSA